MSRRYGGIDPPDAEYIDRERQIQADTVDDSGRASQAASAAMATTPTGEPPVVYDVRCIFDSRPVSGYDFTFSNTTNFSSTQTSQVFTFQTPQGYRAIPREWKVTFSQIPIASDDQIVAFLQANGADVPNNRAFIGAGTTFPIKSFYLVEEYAPFGMRVDYSGYGGTPAGFISIQVYGNLLPVTGVALPFEATNRKL